MQTYFNITSYQIFKCNFFGFGGGGGGGRLIFLTRSYGYIRLDVFRQLTV